MSDSPIPSESPPDPAEPPTEIVLAVVRCQERLCIARRSALVTGSNGEWSVVTGFLEPDRDPLSQAWTELREELGLDEPVLELRRAPEPVLLASQATGKRFLVHPFLFESSSADVVLNWEHDAFDWVEPVHLEVASFVSWQRAIVAALLAE